MSNSDAAKDKAIYDRYVKQMVDTNISRDDAGMAVSVAIEIIRQVEGKIMDDVEARLGHTHRIAALALTTITELLNDLASTMASAVTATIMEKLTAKAGRNPIVDELVEGLVRMIQGDNEPIEELFKNDMIAKAVDKGLVPLGSKQAIIILGSNPTDQNCNCSSCMTERLLDKEPAILPEDSVIVDEELKVRAVRIDPEVLRRIRRDAELMSQKAGEA